MKYEITTAAMYFSAGYYHKNEWPKNSLMCVKEAIQVFSSSLSRVPFLREGLKSIIGENERLSPADSRR